MQLFTCFSLRFVAIKAQKNDAKKANLTYFRDKNGFEVDIITDWKKDLQLKLQVELMKRRNYLQVLRNMLALEMMVYKMLCSI